MSEQNLQQLRCENEGWKRLLNFMLEENVHLKNRLVDSLKQSSDPLFIEQAENFQSQFLKKDMLISLLRDDVAHIDRSLMNKDFKDGESNTLKTRLRKLRNNIVQTEKQFVKLMLDFNNYMAEKN